MWCSEIHQNLELAQGCCSKIAVMLKIENVHHTPEVRESQGEEKAPIIIIIISFKPWYKLILTDFCTCCTSLASLAVQYLVTQYYRSVYSQY